MLLIALYTYISLYMPSLLNFSNKEYVAQGGDHLTDELFLSLLHYANLFAFYVLNIGFIMYRIIKKKSNGIKIAIVSILLMIGIHIWKNSATNNKTIQVEENYIKIN